MGEFQTGIKSPGGSTENLLCQEGMPKVGGRFLRKLDGYRVHFLL